MDNAAFIKGLGLGAGLIVAIGAQNAFLLRQGLQRQYVLTCVMICSACDMLLIAAGVAGMGALIAGSPTLLTLARWGGALFLVAYGLRSALSAWKPGTLAADTAKAPQSHAAVIATALAFSLLNPHVYLDTVVLLGSIGGQEAGTARLLFAAGAMSASLLWFVSLGFGARYIAPVFARPLAWRVLDSLMAVVMLALAASLLL